MQAFNVHKGLVAPMDRANVDTDAIIPKQFLKSIARSGFGPNLFDAWRYLDPGEPGHGAGLAPQLAAALAREPRHARASGAGVRAGVRRQLQGHGVPHRARPSPCRAGPPVVA